MGKKLFGFLCMNCRLSTRLYTLMNGRFEDGSKKENCPQLYPIANTLFFGIVDEEITDGPATAEVDLYRMYVHFGGHFAEWKYLIG